MYVCVCICVCECVCDTSLYGFRNLKSNLQLHRPYHCKHTKSNIDIVDDDTTIYF